MLHLNLSFPLFLNILHCAYQSLFLIATGQVNHSYSEINNISLVGEIEHFFNIEQISKTKNPTFVIPFIHFSVLLIESSILI